MNTCSNTLKLNKFYTAGPEQVSSWFIPEKATAAQAAGKIHGDFEKHFISADISKVEDWVKGKVEPKRFGKDYIMQPGDVMDVKHRAS